LRNVVLASAGMIFCAALAVLPAAQDSQQATKRKTVRDAVYTDAQAQRGKKVYEANCVTCHLPDLDGSANPTAEARGAPLVGTRFVQDFGESKVSALFNKMKRDMPSGKPGTLTDQQYLDAASFVLQRNHFPAGAAELTVDTVGDYWIPGAGGAEGLPNYAFVSTVGCLHQDPTRSWLLTGAQELKKTELPAAGAAASAVSVPAVLDTPGEFTFRLLDAISYNPEPYNEHKVRVTGYMVRLGAEIRVNVESLQMVGASCGN